MNEKKLPFKFWGELRSKLDDSVVKCIFVGYGKCEKGYRVYNLHTKKIEVSRSVIFDEGSLWNWEKQNVVYVTIPMSFGEHSNVTKEDYDVTTPSAPESHTKDDVGVTKIISGSSNASAQGESPSSTHVKLKDITEIYARCNMSIIEPENFEEASRDKAWQQAIEAEMEMIEKNETWELVDRPSEKPVISVKWVYKTKLNLDGSIQKHKARLVVKGYAQKPRIDFNKTFAPVASLDTIRTLIALAAQKG
ncbi:hypothetical protein L3X38_010035 [Prunus dulcis]|uniref:Reverse transcriptase Ty1/copia-type domain-containing protein n=1 Tax=Prunus dulcis TaxID=3755 RepID=A0AAD4ZDM9_PRUDU|nr:hypothetical protein L3X38_010035 [Prunus dulcis]